MKTIDKNIKILIILALLVSVASFAYCYNLAQLNLKYGDSLSRLNISRKIVDNLTPGFAQLGNIWLPLPQILMLPFVWSERLWHTGLAGYLMSGAAYVGIIVFLYKLSLLLFNSTRAGFIAAIVGLLNPNLIYFQTTAMSEIIFIFTLVGSAYFIAKWIKTKAIYDLLLGALFVSCTTLIRYEGYFVLLISIALVIYVAYLKGKKLATVEGTAIIFTTLAATGVMAWLLYCGLIFNDPFYWKKIYSGENSIISTDIVSKKIRTDQNAVKAQEGDIIKSLYDYGSATAQMNGIILTSATCLCSLGFLVYLIRRKAYIHKPELLVIVLLTAPLLFVVMTLYKGNIPLYLPALSLKALLNRDTSLQYEYNIRYGLLMFPLVAILFSWLASKSRMLWWILLSILLLQVFTVFFTPFYTIYSIPAKLASTDPGTNYGKNAASDWLKINYDGGLILISALKHDPEMFYLGIDYKNFIHEGTGHYWLESVKMPQKYAKWIFMYKQKNTTNSIEDSVTKYIYDMPQLYDNFDTVYDDGTYVIFKRKI